MRQFLRLPGLGPKTAARIWRELGVTTLEGLREAAEQQRVRTLQGLGAKSEERILEALAKGFGPEPERRGLLGVGLPVVREIVAALQEHPAAVEVSAAGSARRGRETFRDLDVIATATEPAELIDHFVGLPWVLEVAAKGETKATVVTKQGLRVDLRVVPPEDFGSLLQHFTGSKHHNVALREDAQRRGFSVSEYGVTVVETGEVHRFRAEDELYRFLGYEWIPPELRENGGELEAARDGGLPDLVEVDDLVGELHCHSTWSSDGKGTIEEMARAARALGNRYLALTDHSHYLREGRMEAQWREIEEVNARVKPFRILRGVEANIRADGTVDVDDDVLAELDWVVASLHAAFDRNPTERVLAAIEHPHVDCIGHLTGRKLNRRTGRGAGRREGDRPRGRDGHRARAQQPARPARPARRPRAARRRGGRARSRHDRRALDARARLPRARHRPGEARLADEGAGAQHAPVARGREAPKVSSFRDDGAAALDWAAAYLERVRDLPVLSTVEPGAIRAALPATAPETAEPFDAVLRDLDDVLLPGLTHWQSPRYFAYFATTGSEPGILAELLVATLNQVGILWRTSPALQELEEVTLAWLAELLGLPAGLHGHLEDTASTGLVTALAAARAAAPGRRVVVCSEHTHSSTAKAARLLELELRVAPTDDAYGLRPDAST